MRAMVRVVVAASVWLGATSFLAGVEAWAPELLLHGNPVGTRCVLGIAGGALGLPLGGWLHQLYSGCKVSMSAERLINVFVGMVLALTGSHAIVGTLATAQRMLGAGVSLSWAWGIAPPLIGATLVCALGPDSRGVLRRCWPRLDHTIDVVRSALTPAKERVPDLRFLTRHQMAAIAQTGILEGTWVVPAPTVARLRHWSRFGTARIRHRAQRTLATLNDLQRAAPARLVLRVGHYPPAWGHTRAMLAEASRPGGEPLLSRPSRTSLPVSGLLLPTCVRALRSPYRVGDSLELPVRAQGQREGQAQGTLEDGTLVLITQGAPYVGETVRVEVVHVLYSVTGVLVFARVQA